MLPSELQYFLRRVRRETVLDYLDPLGETVDEALGRRLRWAAEHKDDLIYLEEALFLLSHADELRAQALLDAEQQRLARPTAQSPSTPLPQAEDVAVGLTRLEDLTPLEPLRRQELPPDSPAPFVRAAIPPATGCTPEGRCNEGLLAKIPHAEYWGLALFLGVLLLLGILAW